MMAKALFSVHLAPSFPRKVISESPARVGGCPWPRRIGREKVRDRRRPILRILMIFLNILNP
jgi:hypothetical protein